MRRFAKFLSLSVLFLAPPALAADPVVVHLANGVRVKAEIDPRSNEGQLWLSTYLERGHLSQVVSWEQVKQIEIDGQILEGSAARAAATKRAQEALQEIGPESLAQPEGERNDTRSRQLEAPGRPPTSPRPSVKVLAMSVSAHLANWDQDSAIDGLEVEIMPLDSYGAPTACDGAVSITLQAWKDSSHSNRPGQHSERWTKSVRADQFDGGRVVFRLPFRVLKPGESSQWRPHGALVVRLTVPGSGVVERTLTDLRIRPFEPMRDGLEATTGRRYLPGENASRQAWSPW